MSISSSSQSIMRTSVAILQMKEQTELHVIIMIIIGEGVEWLKKLTYLNYLFTKS